MPKFAGAGASLLNEQKHCRNWLVQASLKNDLFEFSVMNASSESQNCLRLGRVVYDMDTRQLIDPEGRPIALRKKSLHLLGELAARNSETIGRDELITAVWAGKFVSDDSLGQCVKDIRSALEDKDHQLLRTAVGRGYSLHGVRQMPFASGSHPKILIPSLRVDDETPELNQLAQIITEELVIAVFPRVGLKVVTDEEHRETALYAIVGRVSLFGDDVRVFVQLVKGKSGEVAFAETWNIPINENNILPRQITERIGNILRVHMFNHAGEDHIERSNETLTTQELLAKAAYHMSRTTLQNRDAAREVLSIALEREPSNPMVLAMRASTAVISILQEGYAKLPDPPKYCLDMADRAVGLAPQSDFVSLTRGCMRLWFNADHHSARSDFERALEISPVFHLAHQFLATSEILSGEHVAGVERVKRFIALGEVSNPRYPHYLALLALGQVLAGEIDAAVQTSRESHERAPSDPWCSYVFAAAVADRDDLTSTPVFQDMIGNIALPFSHFRDLPFTDERNVKMLEKRLARAGFPNAPK